MNGLGTEVSPYVITKYSELIDAWSAAGYYKLANDIDAKDEPVWNNVESYFTDIDLNGKLINNIKIASGLCLLRSMANQVIRNGRIVNINGENVGAVIDNTEKKITLQNVAMSANIAGGTWTHGLFDTAAKSNIGFYTCSVNIKARSRYGLFGFTDDDATFHVNFTDSQIKVDYDVLGGSTPSTSTYAKYMLGGNYYNSFLTGKVKTYGIENTVNHLSHSMIAINILDTNVYEYFALTAENVNVLDSSLIAPGNTILPQSCIVQGTTEQCKSATWLADQGFYTPEGLT